jgi:hypothetical protein
MSPAMAAPDAKFWDISHIVKPIEESQSPIAETVQSFISTAPNKRREISWLGIERASCTNTKSVFFPRDAQS